MNVNDTSDLSLSSKNKFDLNQFLVYSLNPLSDDNQKFEIGPATAQEKMILQLFIFHDPIILVPIDQHILLRPQKLPIH